MNILISSCLLAGALCLVAIEIGKIGTAMHAEYKKRNTEPERPQKRHVSKMSPIAADWDRIMEETKIERRGKKK